MVWKAREVPVWQLGSLQYTWRKAARPSGWNLT